MRLFSQPTLDCAGFYAPGSDDVPFPYPPPNATMTSCRSVLLMMRLCLCVCFWGLYACLWESRARSISPSVHQPSPNPSPETSNTQNKFNSCAHCAGACATAALEVKDRPISPLAGFDGRLVLVRCVGGLVGLIVAGFGGVV